MKPQPAVSVTAARLCTADLPLPAFAAKLAFGEMAEALLLCSSRVVPGVLNESGFEFAHPELEGALRHQLGK